MKSFFVFITLVTLPLVTPATSLAQTIVIKAIQVQDQGTDSSLSTTVIELNQQQQAQSQTIADILRQVPGVEVIRQGGVGQTATVFIRGARSESTLVLIDGVEANDVMSPSAGFDFSTMSLENIERIEIYRGPQSVRFGAGALGGVINIITKEGQSSSQHNYFIEGGSYSTMRTSVSSSGKKDNLGYSVGGGYLSTEGFSAASEEDGNSEADGAQTRSGSVKLSWTPTQATKIETTARYSEADVEIDSTGGPGGDDLNNKTYSKQLLTGLKVSEYFLENRLQSSLGFYFSEMTRDGRNEPDAMNTTNYSDFFLSEARKIQSENIFSFSENQNLLLNLNYRDESGIAESEFNGTLDRMPRKNQKVTGQSLSYEYESSTWFFDVGARSDQSSQAGTITSYRGSIGRHLPNQAKAFLSVGSGFKLPSLYQLYSAYGDENLQSEKSTSLEIGIEAKLFESSTFTIATFQNKYENMIDYNATTNTFFNLAKARSQGTELQITSKVTPQLQVAGNFTQLEAIDESTHLRLVRRPQNTFSLSATWSQQNYELSAQYSYRSSRMDLDPINLQRIELDSYSLVSLGSSYKFSGSFTAHGRIENLMNEIYEEVAGYGTARCSFYVGVAGAFD